MHSKAPAPAKASRRAARGEISRERIGFEALALIDEQGLDALSLRTLAQRLGCEAMSVYHHVSGKDGVLDAVVEQLIAEVALPDPQGRLARELVQAVCESYRAVARRHPHAFVLLAARRFTSERTLRFLEYLLQRFADAGLSPAEGAQAFRMLGYFLNGAGLAEGAVAGDGPLSAPIALADAAPETLPQVRKAARWLGTDGLDAVYLGGMDALMAWIFER